MADTTYVNGVTLTDADWFNDVNRLHYTIFGDPSTVGAARTNLGAIQNCFCGRLTLATATPVMTSDQTAKTTIYYTPYKGDVILIYDGTYMVPTVFTELSQATTDSTKSPAAVTTNSNYDLFVWNDSGTIRCTRGPAWSSDTARGTGAGTTELELVKGVYLNKVSITNGPAANRGTYVGTIRSNGSSQIDWKLGSAAAGGGEAFLGVWNMYNRVIVNARVEDTTDSWTYASTTVRAMNNSNTNRVSFISGLAEDGIYASKRQHVTTGAAAENGFVMFGIDSTSGASAYSGKGAGTAGTTVFSPVGAALSAPPQLGFHYVQALEGCGAAGTVTFNGDVGGTQINATIEAVLRA